MKIVYLHQYFATPQMQGGTRSYELAKRLVARGHEVHVVTSDRLVAPTPTKTRWRHTVEAGVHVHWTCVPYDNRMGFLRRAYAFVQFAIRAARKAIDLDSDIVFATSTPLTIAIPAVRAARRNGIPMVFEVRDLWPAVPIEMRVIRNPILKWATLSLELFAYENAERIVALAPGMKDHVVSRGFPEERVTVIPNGCDNYLFAGRDAEAAKLRASYDWLRDRQLVLYCGSIGLINGVDYLAHIAREVETINSNIRFVVVGDGKLADQLRATAKSCGVLDRTFFMVGPLSKEQTAAWQCACDMSIALISGPEILSKHATQNKFFDSLAARKPVANNFVGWQSQIAVAHAAGLVIASDDAPLAAHQLVSKLENREWMDQAARNAGALAATEFDRDKHAIQLETVLSDALESYAVRRRTNS